MTDNKNLSPLERAEAVLEEHWRAGGKGFVGIPMHRRAVAALADMLEEYRARESVVRAARAFLEEQGPRRMDDGYLSYVLADDRPLRDAVATLDSMETGRPPAPVPEYEYGVRYPLSEESHGPGATALYRFPERVARESARDGRGTLMRRTVGPWEETQ